MVIGSYRNWGNPLQFFLSRFVWCCCCWTEVSAVSIYFFPVCCFKCIFFFSKRKFNENPSAAYQFRFAPFAYKRVFWIGIRTYVRTYFVLFLMKFIVEVRKAIFNRHHKFECMHISLSEFIFIQILLYKYAKQFARYNGLITLPRI